jgi:ketopantoate reductase
MARLANVPTPTLDLLVALVKAKARSVKCYA